MLRSERKRPQDPLVLRGGETLEDPQVCRLGVSSCPLRAACGALDPLLRPRLPAYPRGPHNVAERPLHSPFVPAMRAAQLPQEGSGFLRGRVAQLGAVGETVQAVHRGVGHGLVNERPACSEG
jgi:hypothetical protein